MVQAPSVQRPGRPVASETSRGASLVQRLVAGGYDRIFDHVDTLGGADHRRRLVEHTAGQVLEIGAGTGRNLPLYRHATRLVALAPGPGMRARAHQAARAAPVAVEILDGTVEDLPLPDASFDTVVASLVLCTVPDLAGALAEARRVLRPGGRLRFYQQVRADDPRLAAGRTGWSAPGAGWPEAATPTTTSSPPSPPPGSECWSWTGSTSRSCRRWSAPTSSAWPSGPRIPASFRWLEATPPATPDDVNAAGGDRA